MIVKDVLTWSLRDCGVNGLPSLLQSALELQPEL
jgi:hypothetical protein